MLYCYPDFLALPPVPELEPEPAPMPLSPQWLEEALRKHLPDYQPSAVGVPSVVAPLPEVETDARWMEVIIPPAVVLVLDKREGGKSVLSYRLPQYVVGASTTARQLLPDVLVAVNPAMLNIAPDVVEFLRNWDFTARRQTVTEKWMHDNNATTDETAVFFLKTWPAVWTEWVPEDVAQRVQAAIAQKMDSAG